MKYFRIVTLFSSVGLAAAAACGGTTENTAAPTTGVIPEAGVVEPSDSGTDALPPDPLDPSYPTKHTAIPLVDNLGGSIIKNPKVVTITFDGDTKRDTLEAFGDAITTTKWWDAVRDGYCDAKGNCIGQGTGGGHVHLDAAAAKSSYTDSSQGGASTIQDMIKGYVADGTFPPPDSDTIYAIYFPATTSIDLDNSASCSTFGGYHNSVTAKAGIPDGGLDEGGVAPSAVEVAYAILPRCSSSTGELTIAASHEIIEAATDPYITAPTYYMQNQLWAFLGGEVGDLCVSYRGDDSYQEGNFLVQRSWSNKAAAASHEPCVPGPDPATQPYFNMAPAANQDQVTLKVGASKTIELTGFSDAPMAADWSIDAQEFSDFMGGSNVLSFSFDRTTAHNGSKINMTVTLNAKPSGGYAIYSVTSKSGNTTHDWPMAVLGN